MEKRPDLNVLRAMDVSHISSDELRAICDYALDLERRLHAAEDCPHGDHWWLPTNYCHACGTRRVERNNS